MLRFGEDFVLDRSLAALGSGYARLRSGYEALVSTAIL